MSEAPVKDVPTTEPAAAEPVVDAAAAPAAEAPVVAAETPAATLPTEEAVGADAVKIEAQPASEGVLGYKAPGLIKSLRFSKKFFWFGDEKPVEEKHLSAYLQNEKPAVAHPNVAHASQTGAGLLFFAKRVEDKSTPAGIINLGEASAVTKEGLDTFYFTLNGHKHAFQAANKAESDSWVVAVEARIVEAKAAHEGLVGSEGYKKSLSKYAAPTAAVAAVATDKAAKPDKVHDGTAESSAVTTTATPAEASTTPKTVEKSRSQSRKRQSLFGKVLGKKDEVEEKKEAKKEEKKEEKAEEKAVKKEDKAEAKEAKKEENAEAKEEKAEEKAEEKEAKKEEKAAETPAPKTKRASVFGSLFKKDNVSPTRERKDKEVAPVVPAKDGEAVPAVAPVAPQLDPVSTSVETAAPAEAAATAPVPATTTTVTAATPEPAKEKRRQSFFGTISGKKEKKEGATSDAEVTDGEGKKPTSGKLGGLFRRVSRSAKGSTSPAHDESTAPPLPISKDVAATENTPATTEAASAPETNGSLEPATETPAVPESATPAPAVTASA